MKIGVQDLRDIIYEQWKRAGYKGGTRPGQFAQDTAELIYELLEAKGMTRSWDILHDFPEDLNRVVIRLEKGLMLNMFPKDENAKVVYRWILEQEQEGRKLETWTKWAMHPSRIKFVFSYRKDPSRIVADYPQAFLGDDREVFKAPEEKPKVITPDMLRRNG